MLMAAGLPSTYWSSAITHVVYLKNCLTHKTMSPTPIEAYIGSMPNLVHLRVFVGSYVTGKNHPGKRPTKLVKHVSYGIF